MVQGQKRQNVRVTRVAVSQRESGAAPIPDGAKIGNIFASSLLPGRNTDDGTTPQDPFVQAEWMFKNMVAALKQVGGSPDDIVQLTLYIQDETYRPPLNKEWLKMFPDPDNRPARIVVYREFGRERVGGGQANAEESPTRIFFEVSFIAVLGT